MSSAILRAARRLCIVALSVLVVAAGPVSAAGKRIAAIQSTLYFGLSSDNGKGVSEQEWAAFLADVVTPRFPDGLTVFAAYGQSGGDKRGKTLAETTKVLLIVHPDTAAAAGRIDEIAAEFRRRFGQGAFRTEQPVTIVE